MTFRVYRYVQGTISKSDIVEIGVLFCSLVIKSKQEVLSEPYLELYITLGGALNILPTIFIVIIDKRVKPRMEQSKKLIISSLGLMETVLNYYLKRE